MKTGTVKFFSASKGYGFITPDDGGEEVFVHYSAIDAKGYRKFEDNDRVEYEAERGDKGYYATKARKLSKDGGRGDAEGEPADADE